MPHGGTSQPKLFGSYKLFMNGHFVGMGPGRRVNGTQGVDAIDVTSLLNITGLNAVGLQGGCRRFGTRLPPAKVGYVWCCIRLRNLRVFASVAQSSTWAAAPLGSGQRPFWDVRWLAKARCGKHTTFWQSWAV
jgi:hypothetical protein